MWKRLVLLLGLVPALVAPPAGAASDRGRLTAFDPLDGSRSWSVSAPRSGGGFEIVAVTRSAVIGTLNRCRWDDQEYQPGASTLIAWASKDGRELWRVSDVGSGFVASTEPPGGNVVSLDGAQPRNAIPVFSASRRELRGVSVQNGKELWLIDTGAQGAVMGDDTHVLLTPPRFESRAAPAKRPAAVTLVDARTGARKWSTPVGVGSVAGAALLPDGVAVLVEERADNDLGAPRRLVMLDRERGTPRWERPIESYSLGGYGLVPQLQRLGDLLLMSSPEVSVGVDPATGDELWRLDGGMRVSGAFLAANTPMLLAQQWSSSNAVGPEAAIDAASGRVQWTAPNGQRVLTPGDDVLVQIPDNLWHERTTGVVVDPLTGADRWTTQISDDDSLLAGRGTLYRGTGCATTLAD